MPSGIMDQYVSVFGEEHAAIRIDCRSLEHQTVRLARRNRSSRREHHGEARARRLGLPAADRGMRRSGDALLPQRFPEVKCLRDATSGPVEKGANAQRW